MTIETFRDNFWGPGGFDTLEKRINQGTESSKHILYFLKERASIEESYAKNLQSLLKKSSNVVEYGTLRDAWLAVRGQVETTIATHLELSNKLEKEIVSSFNKFKSEQKKVRRNFVHDGWKLSKERKDQEHAINKYRTKYEDYTKQVNQLTTQLDSAKGSGKSLNEIGRITSRLQKASKEQQAFETDYRDAVAKLANGQPAWEEKTAQIYQSLQGTEEERLDCTKIHLDRYVNSVINSQIQINNVELQSIVGQIDKYEDINMFIRENKTGSEKPSIPSFVPSGGSGRGSDEYSSYSSSSLSTSSPSPSTYSTSEYTSPAPISRSASSVSNSSKAPPPAVVARKPLKKQVRALYEYVGTDATELDFYTGDIITVLDEDESGWWKGSLDGREGLFPSNYCESIN